MNELQQDSVYDVVIIGAGPAGIQAAIHAVRKNTRVLLLGRSQSSALFQAHVENYACIEGVKSGEELLNTGLEQAKRFGALHTPEDVLKINQENTLYRLELESSQWITARAVIFAMGVSKKKLAVPGEKELTGKGVSYCVDCDANFYRKATVAVVGNRSAAIDGALTLTGYASKVYLIAEKLEGSADLMQRLQDSSVTVLSPNWVKKIQGDKAVTAVLLSSGESLAVDGIFIELGSKGALELATLIGVELDTETFKYINANRRQETNMPGLYAAGDITGPPYQMAKAVGEGCIAGMEAASYARQQKKAGA